MSILNARSAIGAQEFLPYEALRLQDRWTEKSRAEADRVMRKGWRAQGRPRRPEDLSVIWYDRGHEILVDAGKFGYPKRTKRGTPLWKTGSSYNHPSRIYVESDLRRSGARRLHLPHLVRPGVRRGDGAEVRERTAPLSAPGRAVLAFSSLIDCDNTR